MNPTTFVINLDEDSNRLSKMDTQLTHLGINYERMSAVRGSNLTTDELYPITSPICHTFCTSSMVGIWLSHYNCWLEIHERKIPYGIILEDDVTLETDYKEQVNAVLSVDIDWDIILLGCFLCNEGKMKKNKEMLYVPYFWGGLHAYIISKRGAAKLIENYRKATFHVDLAIALDSNLSVYALSRQVVHQQTIAANSHNSNRGFWSKLDNIRVDSDQVGLGFILGSNQAQILGMNICLGEIVLTVILLIFILIYRKSFYNFFFKKW